jgi:hypothetical protein
MENAEAHRDKHHASEIERLCDELEFSEQEVAPIYKAEFDRLATEARIVAFLDILAMSNTRSILRRARSRVISS